MATDDKQTVFHVEFNGLKLPDDISKEIELEIRQVVLKQLAKLDFKGKINMADTTCIQVGKLGLWLNTD
jgi:hypothetical protein